MTRLGWALMLGFAIVVAGFAALVKRGERIVPAPQSRTAPIPAAGVVIPVAGVKTGQLADTWDDARGDGTRAHHAIDIPAPRGTPVVAAAAGRVEKLFESRNGGHTIYIRRIDPAWQDYYAHLDAYAPSLTEGAIIRRGQPIGTVGATGDADPAAPHLHFEIHRMAPGESWWEGKEVDPYPVLTRDQ